MNKQTIKKRDYNQEAMTSFVSNLALECWDDVYTAVNTNDKFNKFHAIVTLNFNQCFPEICCY